MNAKFHSGLISGWENDTEGVDEEPLPHGTPEKEILWAAENGDAELVTKLLISNKNLTKCVDEDSYTPLHRAVYNNHLNILNILLQYGADYTAETIDKWTPLHSACHWNSAKCADKIISLGLNVNHQSKGGVTPLHLAASNKLSVETLQTLLYNQNIDTTIKNNSNETAYEIAVRSGRLARFFEVTERCFNII